MWEFLLGCYSLSSTTGYKRRLRTARRSILCTMLFIYSTLTAYFIVYFIHCINSFPPMGVNFSGNLCFDKITDQYVPGYNHIVPFKLGDLNGETKLSGSLLKP